MNDLIDDEPLTTNNFYKQRIEVYSKNPMYVKNYRLLHVHTAKISFQVQKRKRKYC